MFRDLYRSRPHLGMIYVAMKSLRTTHRLLWWKLPHDPADGCREIEDDGSEMLADSIASAALR
jgi:hypothetical protein